MLNETEKIITQDALNYYRHYVVNRLDRRDLGDIERANLEIDKKRLDSLLEKFKYFD